MSKRTVSDKYRTIETHVMVASIEQAIKQLGLPVKFQYSRLSQSRDCTVFEFPTLSTTEMGGITPTIRFYNSYDGSTSAKFKVGFLRKVCSNGMCIGEHLFNERIIHIKGQATERAIEAIPAKVAAAVQYLQSELLPMLRVLNNTEVSPVMMSWIVERLRVPKKVKARLQDSVYGGFRPTYDQKNSLFSLFNMANELIRKDKRTTANSIDKYNSNLLKDIVELAAA